MIYEYQTNGLEIKTGDLICTADGGDSDIRGQFWRLVGKLIPGEVDHIVVYVGPEGRCVEAGAKGSVIMFDAGNTWYAEKMKEERGGLVDTFYGIAYPLADRGLSNLDSNAIRERVAEYCLAQVGKPYNINFLNSATEDAFYCSQLAYMAYRKQGIDLNTGIGIPNIPGTKSIIFPQEIWSGCAHIK